MRRAGFVAKLLFLLGGLLVWAAQFLFVYGFTGLACARGFDAGTLLGSAIVPTVVLATTFVALLASTAIAAAAMLDRGPGVADEPVEAVRAFWRRGAAVVAGFSIIAILWTGLPALIIEPCG
jgi:hypothetical protein